VNDQCYEDDRCDDAKEADKPGIDATRVDHELSTPPAPCPSNDSHPVSPRSYVCACEPIETRKTGTRTLKDAWPVSLLAPAAPSDRLRGCDHRVHAVPTAVIHHLFCQVGHVLLIYLFRRCRLISFCQRKASPRRDMDWWKPAASVPHGISVA